MLVFFLSACKNLQTDVATWIFQGLSTSIKMAEWLKDPEMMKELEKEQIKLQVDILKKQEGISRSNISASIKEWVQPKISTLKLLYFRGYFE